MKQQALSVLQGILFVQIFVLVVAFGVTLDFNNQNSLWFNPGQIGRILAAFSGPAIGIDQAELMFRENILALAGDNTYTLNIAQKYIEGTSPQQILGTHIQALAFTIPVIDTKPDGSVINPAPEPIQDINPSVFKGHSIFLYCTHSAETYIPDSGKARLDGQRGLVNQVARQLEKDFNALGVDAQFIDTIHDYPEYNKSYTKSRETVKTIVENNEKLAAILDIHRDSIPGKEKAETVTIKGKTCAPILIIVGTDERKPHPNWKENYSLARSIYNEAEKSYPGLVKGVRTKAGTYNQEYDPHALLLEFGSDNNRLQDALNSCEYMAEVLLTVLEGELDS